MVEKIDINSVEMNAFYEKQFYFSPSGLNKLLFSPRAFYKHYILEQKEETISSSLVGGKLLHCLLLEPEKFNDNFIITPGKLPSDSNRKVIDILFNDYNKDEHEGLVLNDFSDKLLEILVSIHLHQSLKTDQQRLDKLLTEDNINYFEFLTKKGNKSVIDSDTLNKANESIEYIKDNEIVMSLMALNGPRTYNELLLSTELAPKLPFGLRGVIDNLVIDEEDKVIYVNDLKTTSKPLLDFSNSIEKYNYHLQAATYYILAKEHIKTLVDNPEKYRVVFTFITIDNFNSIYPFQVSDQTMNLWIKELNKTLKIANYHYVNKEYNLPYELATYSIIL